MAQTWRFKRDWKSILHTAHLLGIAHLNRKEKKRETSFGGFVRLQVITLISSSIMWNLSDNKQF